MARLSIEVTADQHQAIKVMAAMQGMKIKDFILQNILPKKDTKDITFMRPDGTKLRASKQLKQALKELSEGDVLHYSTPDAFFAKYGL